MVTVIFCGAVWSAGRLPDTRSARLSADRKQVYVISQSIDRRPTDRLTDQRLDRRDH